MLQSKSATILLDSAVLRGDLSVPDHPLGFVLFAHGSGSSRLSPRNVFVAKQLGAAGVATLLFDLLTEAEDTDRQRRFDIEHLTSRLMDVLRWAQNQEDLRELPIGLFGASTGAAAALKAAARSSGIKAVVSRGGRPDLAEQELQAVHSPTLFIVGSLDRDVLDLNLAAMDKMPAETMKEVKIVPGASHLFEEPGALEQVANLAADWFRVHLGSA